MLTRMIAEDFEAKHGVAAAAVNRPSEGGPFPGAASVAQAAPDGYTVGSIVVDTPQEVRDVLIESAKETIMSERAQAVAVQTGAAIYWQDQDEAMARIVSDIKVTAAAPARSFGVGAIKKA